MNTRNYLLAFIIALSLFLCGCMGGRELNTLGIAIALGIDKVGNSYQVTYQILNPKALASQKNVSEAPFILYEETGEDLFEIIRRFTTLAPRKIYNSHLKLVVFGESFAKEGIREIIDFFTRDHEFRSDFFFAVSNGSTANKLLSTITPLETVPGMAIYNSIRTAESSWAPVKPIRTLELVNVLASDGINPVLTGLGLLDRGNRTVSDAALQQINPTKVRLTGLAVFKKDKLVGWLTEEESKGYSYITGNVKDTVGHIQYDEKNRITFEVIKSEAKTIAYILEGNPAIKVEIDVKSNVAAETGILDVSTEENEEKLNSFIEEQIASFCYASIKKAKENLGTDIYGFGEELHRTYPDYWKEISQNWNKEFPELAVIVKVNSEINGLGQNTRSILFNGEN